MTLKEQEKRRSYRRDGLIAFVLPILIFYIAYVFYGLYPIGNRHLLTIDLYHQYAPFLVEYGRKLRAGESIFFSWSGGLGTSFYPLFTYYLASPLNLIMVFIPMQWVSEAVLLITLVKVGLMGYTFRILLTHAFRSKDRTSILFSGFYALSNYVLAYSWNIMWLDTMILFPLAVLGLIRLMRGESKKLYVITVALMLMFNYYSAFFACVFLALYAIVLLSRYFTKEGFPVFIDKLGLFIIYSFISILLAAVVLLPTAKALSITSAAGDAFPSWGRFSDSMFDHLGQLEILRTPNVMSGLPNIYVGLLPLLLLPYFFLSKRIERRTKLFHAGLIVFLFISFYSAVLDFSWHGFHYPNSLDYRYAFVLVLLLLMMGYKALPEVRKYGIKPAFIMSLVLLIPPLLREWKQKETATAGKWRVLATIILLISYLIILQKRGRYHGGKKRRQFAKLGTTALCVVMLIELLVNVNGGVYDLQKTYPLGDRVHYTANERATEIKEKIESIKKEENNPYTRFEILPDTTVNDPMLYSSNGFTIFASTFPQAPIDFMAELGYPTNGVNSFQYKQSTILMDSIMGIEYLFRSADSIVREVEREQLVSSDNYQLFKNNYAIPFGFYVPQTAADINVHGLAVSPFVLQNQMNYLMGGSNDVFEELRFTPWMAEGAFVEESSEDNYQFHAQSSPDSDWAFVYATAPETATYYLAWEDINAGIKNVNGFLRNGSEFFYSGGKTRGILELGEIDENDIIHFRLNIGKDGQNEGDFRAYLVKLNEKALIDTINTYKSAVFENVEQSASKFSGNINAPARGFVFVPTFTHPGWKVKVDGEVVEPKAIRESFMLIPVEAGPHEVEAKFTPPAFYPGLVISLVTLAACIVWPRYKKQRLLKATNKNTTLNSSSEDLDSESENVGFDNERLDIYEENASTLADTEQSDSSSE